MWIRAEVVKHKTAVTALSPPIPVDSAEPSTRRVLVPDKPGDVLSHYRLVEKIGEGGMGVVWKAVDTTLDREVTISILPELFSHDGEQ